MRPFLGGPHTLHRLPVCPLHGLGHGYRACALLTRNTIAGSHRRPPSLSAQAKGTRAEDRRRQGRKARPRTQPGKEGEQGEQERRSRRPGPGSTTRWRGPESRPSSARSVCPAAAPGTPGRAGPGTQGRPGLWQKAAGREPQGGARSHREAGNPVSSEGRSFSGACEPFTVPPRTMGQPAPQCSRGGNMVEPQLPGRGASCGISRGAEGGP